MSVGAFFFQNDVLPKAQVKMWTLLFSAKQKSPELEIPEGSFYGQIPGYNLYVKSKNQETGMLHGVMIYDISKGGDNATILVADSGQLAFTKDSKYLYLHLFEGEQFEKLREQKMSDRNVPFRRETFDDKEILIPFDNNFSRLDEGGMRKQYVGKNMQELIQTLDSLDVRLDSLRQDNALSLLSNQSSGMGVTLSADTRKSVLSFEPKDRMTLTSTTGKPSHTADMRFEAAATANVTTATADKAAENTTQIKPLDLDSILQALSPADQDRVFSGAESAIKSQGLETEFRALQMRDEKGRYRRHEIELLKKFTLSVACLVFLFIGAPLGAIIRKGGLGTPLVISVLLFVVYYIIDNTGYKLARDGHWIVWIGVWLSTFVLLPLGIFVTYKAMNDSSVFNADAYKEWFRRRLGLPDSRHIAMKEVVINDINRGYALAQVENLYMISMQWLSGHKQRPGYSAYWAGAYAPEPIDLIGDNADKVVVYLSDSRDPKVINALNKYPATRGLWILRPFGHGRAARIMKYAVPLGAIFYILALPYARRVYREISGIAAASRQTAATLATPGKE